MVRLTDSPAVCAYKAKIAFVIGLEHCCSMDGFFVRRLLLAVSSHCFMRLPLIMEVQCGVLEWGIWKLLFDVCVKCGTGVCEAV